MGRRGFNDPKGSPELNVHFTTIDQITRNLTNAGKLALANVDGVYSLAPLLTPAAVAAGGPFEQTITINGAGLLPGDFLLVRKSSTQVGLILLQGRISALDTLALTFYNTTGAPITPTSETYQILGFRFS